MKRETLRSILKKSGYSDVAVRKIISGERRPSYEKIIRLNRDHRIPFVAWADIRSYIQPNDTANHSNKAIINE